MTVRARRHLGALALACLTSAGCPFDPQPVQPPQSSSPFPPLPETSGEDAQTSGTTSSGTDSSDPTHVTSPMETPPTTGPDGDSGTSEPTDEGSSGAFPIDPDRPFIIGADISSVHERDDVFRDTDGQTKSIFALLQNHGFNYIRVKTFVDPMADYGYASSANGCFGMDAPYSDRDHVVAFGREIKEAGMGFLLAFHYSDVWADPGNQIIPEAWRGSATIEELAAHVEAYTTDVLVTAIEAGARPDMVQIGNEITPGMLMHVPGPNTDCWGNSPAAAPLGGGATTSNWPNLAVLLRTAIDAVRATDPSIKVMLHLENTDDLVGARWWLKQARAHGVEFDVLGLSCYTLWQGPPSTWRTTFENLARDYPELEFVVAEYGGERIEANTIMYRLPDQRGLGTFIWEPTRSGPWGTALFTYDDGVMVANEQDFAEFDQIRATFGL